MVSRRAISVKSPKELLDRECIHAETDARDVRRGNLTRLAKNLLDRRALARSRVGQQRQNRWIGAEKRLLRASQPRTSQTSTTPTTADAIPTSRNALSGVSVTCAIARFTAPGKAANRMPSMANTRPIATRKSDIPANRPYAASRELSRRR